VEPVESVEQVGPLRRRAQPGAPESVPSVPLKTEGEPGALLLVAGDAWHTDARVVLERQSAREMGSVKSPERSAARQLGFGSLQHPATVTEQTPAHAAASCAQWLGKTTRLQVADFSLPFGHSGRQLGDLVAQLAEFTYGLALKLWRESLCDGVIHGEQRRPRGA
jgi:hypothetical protein